MNASIKREKIHRLRTRNRPNYRLRVTADETLSVVALIATFVILTWLLREVGGFILG